MSDAKVLRQTTGVGRLGTAAAWISAFCCLPYLILKVVWTVGLPVGIADQSVVDDSGWVAANAVMAALQLAGLLLVLALTRPWARRVPAWLLLFPVWVGTGLLFEIAVGAVLMGLLSSTSHTSSSSTGGFEPWVFVVVYTSFAGQGAALAIAFACYVRARWGWLLGRRTGEGLARATGAPRSWPERHLAQLTAAAIGMAVAVALVCGYWAAGGSVGLSEVQPRPSMGLHVSGAAGALVVVVGLLSAAGRWGNRRRIWVPAALIWLGSGAVAAFDGLNLLLNKLFLAFGAATSEPGWTVTDTILAIKVLIGVLAAAVGALAITAAGKGEDTAASSIEVRPADERRRVGAPL
jgi:hypothetical protein